MCARQVQVMPMQYFSAACYSNNIRLYFQKSSDMLNENTLGVKKVRGQSEAALQIGMCNQNFDISRGQEFTYQKSFKLTT